MRAEASPTGLGGRDVAVATSQVDGAEDGVSVRASAALATEIYAD